MQFQENDVVVHEVHGVGTILGVEELRWKDKDDPLFYVVALEDARIWVPVEKSGKCHLRPITPKEELSHYNEVFTSKPNSLEFDRFGRHKYLNRSLRNPSFGALCETVRDLTAHGWKTKLAKNEAALLERKTKQVVEEWALSAEIPEDKAQRVVSRLLEELRKSYGPGPGEGLAT